MATILRTPPLGWTLRFAVLRIGAGWRALLAILAGVLLTTIIAASVPLYTAAVAQFGMVQRLTQSPPADTNLFSRTTLAAVNVPDFGAQWAALDADVYAAADSDLRAGWDGWLNTIVGWGESSSMFVVRDGADIDGLKLRIATYADLDSHVLLIDGALPPLTAESGSGGETAVFLPQAVAERYALAVGDRLTLDQRGFASSQPVEVRVAAIIAPKDLTDPYFAAQSPLRVDEARGGGIEANALTTQSAFTAVVTGDVPETRTNLGWNALLNPNRLPAQLIPQAVESLNHYQRDLDTRFDEGSHLNHLYSTKLPTLLTTYAGEVGVLAAPFGVLLLQVGGLSLFFLVITAALVQRTDRREVAMLQSRGAFDGQVLFLRGVEALLICGAAALAAPFIARQILIWLSPLFTPTGSLPLVLDASPFTYAGFAGLLAALALIFTLRPILRLPLISAGGGAARAERQVWWQRYYLDIALLVIGSAALFRLLARDSPFAQSLVGGLRADPLLLIAPALLFVSLGSITLRLFPPLTDLAARLFSARRGAPGAIGAWQVSREPAHYARIAFLLALAIGVGWFATSFGATLARSQADQAAYAVGADVRLTEHDEALGIDRVLPPQSYAALDGVASTTVALRLDDINMAQNEANIYNGTVLGVDLATVTQTAYWRDDLGALPLPTPVETEASGVALPESPARIGLWVRLDVITLDPASGNVSSERPEIAGAAEDSTYSVRLRDGENIYHDVTLNWQSVEGAEGETDLTPYRFNASIYSPPDQITAETERFNAVTAGLSGWIHLEATLPDRLPPPVSFESFSWSSEVGQAYIGSPTLLRLSTSSMIFFNAQGAMMPIDVYASADGWNLGVVSGGVTNSYFSTDPTRHGPGQEIYWTPSLRIASLVMSLNADAVAVPAVISANFAERYFLTEGATFDLFVDRRRVTFIVTGIAENFPTLYAGRAPFVIAALDTLLESLNRHPGTPFAAREVWLDLKPGVSADAFVQARMTNSGAQSVLTALTREGALDALRGDALSLGLSRLLFLSFAVALILSAVSLLAYAALSAQSRRGQFAVLRALGMSSRRITVSVLLEQGLVIAVGVLLGAVMGLLLSSQVLPALALTADGRPLTPPFLVQVESNALLGYGALLTLLLIGVLLATGAIIRQLSLGRALRYGEE